jgi:hypothetical protein
VRCSVARLTRFAEVSSSRSFSPAWPCCRRCRGGREIGRKRTVGRARSSSERRTRARPRLRRLRVEPQRRTGARSLRPGAPCWGTRASARRRAPRAGHGRRTKARQGWGGAAVVSPGPERPPIPACTAGTRRLIGPDRMLTRIRDGAIPMGPSEIARAQSSPGRDPPIGPLFGRRHRGATGLRAEATPTSSIGPAAVRPALGLRIAARAPGAEGRAEGAKQARARRESARRGRPRSGLARPAAGGRKPGGAAAERKRDRHR